LSTDGHGETSIPPYNFVAGGIIKMKNRKYHTVRTVPKSNRKIIERSYMMQDILWNSQT
jgi:hypothetical protein